MVTELVPWLDNRYTYWRKVKLNADIFQLLTASACITQTQTGQMPARHGNSLCLCIHTNIPNEQFVLKTLIFKLKSGKYDLYPLYTFFSMCIFVPLYCSKMSQWQNDRCHTWRCEYITWGSVYLGTLLVLHARSFWCVFLLKLYFFMTLLYQLEWNLNLYLYQWFKWCW